MLKVIGNALSVISILGALFQAVAAVSDWHVNKVIVNKFVLVKILTCVLKT